MVYKRYIKKRVDGRIKTFGPYYYESYRDKEGKTKTRYIHGSGAVTKEGRKKRYFALGIIGLIIILFLIFSINFSERISEDNQAEYFKGGLNFFNALEKGVSYSGSPVYNSIIRLVGFNVKEESQGKAKRDSENQTGRQEIQPEEIPEEEMTEESELTEQAEQNLTAEINATEIPELEEAFGNLTIAEENITKAEENATKAEENITETHDNNVTEVITNMTENTEESGDTAENATEELAEENGELIENATEPKENITENPIEIPAENVTKDEENITETNITKITTIQYGAVIGKPVRWKKNVQLTEPGIVRVELPKEAENITVNKIAESESIKDITESEEVKSDGENQTGFSENITEIPEENITENKEEAEFVITGKTISKETDSGILLISNFFKNIFSGITGKAVDIEEQEEAIEVRIEDTGTEYEIEYETPAPYAAEESTSRGKKIEIVGLEEIHYENILAYTELPFEVSEQFVRLYHLTNGSRQEVSIEKYDTNNNSLIDYVEWIVPYLSNQSYELEIIILNVQSYPMVGEGWTVMFETIGIANLTISAVNGTTWSNESEDNDLKFLEIKCGDETLDYEWKDNSVFIEDYSCENETGFETSKVLTFGKHHLEFDFGGIKAYAHNQAGGWWDSDWQYRKGINITSAGSSALTDFPAYLNVSKEAGMKSDFSDLRFINDSCGFGTTELAFEIENYTETKADIWVKIPGLGTGITQICMYYNNSGASSGENKTGVWNSNYLGVWHLSETSGNANDSTSNEGNGVVTGATRGVAGVVDKACSFDGSSDYIDITINTPSTITISTWATYTSSGTDMMWCLNNAATGGPDLFVGVPGTGVIALNTWDSWGNSFCNVPSSTFMQEWHLYTTVIDSVSTELYIDDWLCGTATYKSPVKTSFAISSSNGYDWAGNMDEFRISNVAETADWVNQSYQMIANQNSYVSFGSEEENLPVRTILISPADGYRTSNATIIFNCSAETTLSNAILSNITLYHNYTAWHKNETKNIGGTENSTTFEKTFPEGIYEWNCLAYNNISNLSWGSTNYTFIIDKTPPTITINSPAGTLADTTPTINLTFGEAVDAAWYNIDNIENITLCTNCSLSDNRYSDLEEGSYTVYVFANDTFGNENNTESNSFTIDMNENYYDDYDDNSSIDIYSSVDFNIGNMSFKRVTNTGDGSDGSLSVSDADTIINSYTYLTGDENSEDNVISVDDGSAFSDGDEILIIQMQNGTSNGVAGSYEFRSIVSGGGTETLTLDSGLNHSYNSGTFNTSIASVTQVVRVLQYTTVSIDSDASITSSAWDGYTGGIVVFRATGSVGVSGAINVSYKGFRGGLHGTLSSCSSGDGEQGESYPGMGACGYYAGNMDGDDPNGGGGGVDVTGGGGGYGTAGTDSVSWNGGSAPVGQGGLEHGTADLEHIFLGSGGGGCYQGGSGSGDGGDGGGVIMIFADSLSVSGSLESKGQNGQGYGQGSYLYGTGGGSGGSIYLLADDMNVGNELTNVSGGIGYKTTRDGGDGGFGRIRLDYNSLSGTTSPDYYAGEMSKDALNGSFTSKAINTTQEITQITNITWTESNTDTDNNISVELSVDSGGNWNSATNGHGLTGFAQDNSLIYRVLFATNRSDTIYLLDMNISWSNETSGGDTEYPQFSDYWDNNASLFDSGTGLFNVTLSSTNGTVLLEINGNNITTTNVSGNAEVFNATYSFTTNGTYTYRWHSWGNGTSQNYNVSADRSYTININNPPFIYPEFPANNTQNITDSTPDFLFNVTDDNSASLDCFLWLRNSTGSNLTYGRNSTTLNSTSTTISANASLTNSDYLWWINCSDGAKTNVSEMRNISINIGAGISISLSPKLSQQINWSLASLPVHNQSAEGNNNTGITGYYVNLSVIGGTIDLYIKASGDLITSGEDILSLGNETFSYNLTNSSVPSETKNQLTTSYTDNKIGENLADESAVYLKFFLNAPSGQAAGIYNNTLMFKAVPYGEPP